MALFAGRLSPKTILLLGAALEEAMAKLPKQLRTASAG
jgi:hypothetical protein